MVSLFLQSLLLGIAVFWAVILLRRSARRAGLQWAPRRRVLRRLHCIRPLDLPPAE